MKNSWKQKLFAGYVKEENFKDQRVMTMNRLNLTYKPFVAKRNKSPLPLALGLTFGIPLTLVGAIVITVVAINRRDTYSFNRKTVDYTLEEKTQIASQSFMPLNEVSYPSTDIDHSKIVSEEYKQSVNGFAQKLYTGLNERNVNSCYSPLSLYAGLDILSSGASDEASEAIDSTLGLSYAKRKSQFSSMYKGDYYTHKNMGTAQMHNGYFLTNQYGMEISDEYLADLTSRYVEAYSLNFHDDEDVGKMLSWVDDKTKSQSFFDKSSLNIFPESDTQNINVFYLFSTLYFKGAWNTAFDGDDNFQDLFYKADGSSSTVDYIQHTSYTSYHEYEDYVSCFDYYQNGESVEYFVPKKTSDSIFTILEGKDFLNEEEETEKKSYISLSLPKFYYDVTTDFSSTLDSIGLSSLSDPTKDPFGKMLKSNPDDYSVYLGFAKQRNIVSFSEEGTTVKTGSVFAGFGFGSAGPGPDGYDINLNQPFVYVIRDSNGLPLYVGQYSNPA